jgi:hypothetical protein
MNSWMTGKLVNVEESYGGFFQGKIPGLQDPTPGRDINLELTECKASVDSNSSVHI